MKTWKRPVAEVETFVANDYVATCGIVQTGTTYKFKCTAGGGVSGTVYLETNGTPGLQASSWNSDTRLGGYHACGTEHETENQNEFLNGYYVTVTGSLWNKKETVTPVIVWRGPNNNNTHCTPVLDESTNWQEILRS